MTASTKGPEYYGRPRREMVARVPAGARRVLDVGCGAGAFGAGLKAEWRRNGRELEVWGLEMDPAAARRANEVLDKVLVGDAESLLPELAAETFDAIMLNDILEHVLQPESLLSALKPHLSAGGCVVSSLPNVRYFPNVVNLAVHGSWEYTDEGILDRTHLRFFTRSSMVALFTGCGFRIEQMAGINPTGSLKFKLANLLTLGRWADMRFLQFAVVARLEETSP